MNLPFNVLHVLDGSQLDGAERIVQLICRYLDRNVFSPVVVCSGEPLRSIFKQEGIPVEVADVHWPTPGNLSHLSNIVKKRQISIIHAHDHRASLVTRLTTLVTNRIPVISHLHSCNPWLKKSWHPMKLAELCLRNFYDVTLTCSDSVRAYYLDHNHWADADKIKTMTNGIEILVNPPAKPEFLATELGIPPNHFVFGTVGRLDRPKGMDLLLKSFKILTEVLENVTLVIVGCGPDEESLKALTRDLHIDGQVIFTGYREDVYDLFQIMDVFVLASRWEGLPMVIMEAMAAGKPVIATDVGGVRELVRPGVTGLLAAPEDIIGLADYMLLLFRDTDFAKGLARSGNKLVRESFNIVNEIRKLEGIYHALLRGEKPC